VSMEGKMTTKLVQLQLECAKTIEGLRQKCLGNDLRDAPKYHGKRYDYAGGMDCGCDSHRWIPVTSLSDAMVAAQKAGIFIHLVVDENTFFAYNHHIHISQFGDTPDLAFWSALHEAVT